MQRVSVVGCPGSGKTTLARRLARQLAVPFVELDAIFHQPDWVDLPRPLVMRRVVARTVRRVLTREELWNGNVEPFTNLYRLDPEQNIIRWAWVEHPVYAQRYRMAMDDPAHAHLDFVRLRTPSDVAAFLD